MRWKSKFPVSQLICNKLEPSRLQPSNFPEQTHPRRHQLQHVKFFYNEFRHTSRRSGSQAAAAAAALNWSDTDPTAYYSLIHSCAERVAVTSGAAHLSVCWLRDVHTCSVCLGGSLLPHEEEISCGEPGDLEGAGATWERSSFAFKNSSETYGQTHQRLGISTYWHTL